jgi:uncharacterized YceG family protein
VGWGLRIALSAFVLATPGLRQFHVVFPEGFTRAQMVQRVGVVVNTANGELKNQRVSLTPPIYSAASRSAVVPCFGAAAQKSTEGFLFPSTYAFDVRTTGANLVANQVTAFCSAWGKLDLSYAQSKNLTPYDVLTIASMVEEEAAQPDDRPKIAAVIYNRLRLRMPLGIDATLRYGLHIPATKSITQAQLASDNPYNTRKLRGLPPTPIGNPGFPSLHAAAHPSTAGWLYYARVRGTKDTQKFFESYTAYEQFLRANGYGPHP